MNLRLDGHGEPGEVGPGSLLIAIAVQEHEARVFISALLSLLSILRCLTLPVACCCVAITVGRAVVVVLLSPRC